MNGSVVRSGAIPNRACDFQIKQKRFRHRISEERHHQDRGMRSDVRISNFKFEIVSKERKKADQRWSTKTSGQKKPDRR
jgi:hypothetical protein